MNNKNFKIAQEFALKIREKLGKATDIILYGSRARGDNELFSDMDVCIIVEKLNRKTREIVFRIAWEVGFKEGIIIVPLIFEKNEWEYSPIIESPIYKNIQREGIKV